MTRASRILKLILASSLAFCAPGALAQAFPSNPVRIVVPFGPGSGADIIGRILADKLSEQMSARVFVENRDGAGGSIGSTQVAGASPDGHTLLLIPSSFTVSLLPTPPYDPVKDFAAISKLAALPLVVVAGADAPYKTMSELVNYARANPGKLSYATSGKGASSHLEFELIKHRYKLNIPDVPYKSFGQAITDTISGQVSFYFAALPATLPHIKSGKVRGIAMGGLQRSEQAPEVPTIAESLNLPGYEASVWYGMLAPAATPRAIINQLDGQIATALKSADVQQRLMKGGVVVSYASSEKFGATVAEETAKWRKLIDELGLRAPK
jgi:tripartite-type tricarboxylate transporter receptor subunit TctC